jgi:hypothetical protein
MQIAYVAPLERAWSRMKAILFHPFELETWIVLGFASFLAALGEGGGSWANGYRYTLSKQETGVEGLKEAFHRVLDVLGNPVWVVLIVFAFLIVLALVVLFLWISSRAKFIFLDDVLHDRAAIGEPWKRFQRLGDSLFLWHLAYSAICFLLILLLVVPLAVVVWNGMEGGWLAARILSLMGLALLVSLVAVAIFFVKMLLNNFVVPIMYRDDVTATAAWGRFLSLFRGHFLRFVLYGLFLFVLAIAVGAVVIVAGCATLCCGFILLMIPYVGSVLILPISVTYRCYGPMFLAQFGPDWSVIPAPPSPEPAPEPPPTPPAEPVV